MWARLEFQSRAWKCQDSGFMFTEVGTVGGSWGNPGALVPRDSGRSCNLSPRLWPLIPPSGARWGLGGHPSMVSDLHFSPTVNPCCYYPCQHQGICVRFGLDRYQCDCTRTGYSGPNCTIRELGLQPSLLPSCTLLLPGPLLLDPNFLPSSLAMALFSFLAWLCPSP